MKCQMVKFFDIILNNNKVISVTTERFQCPEALFQPNLIESEEPGIHEQIYHSIMNSGISLRKEMMNNIVVSGFWNYFLKYRRKHNV